MAKQEQDRAVSPVIGTILLVAVAVILASTVSVFVLGLAEQFADPAPTVAFNTERNDEIVSFLHAGGDRLAARNIAVTGAVAWDTSSSDVRAGSTIAVQPAQNAETIQVLWSNNGQSARLATADRTRVDPIDTKLQLTTYSASTAGTHTWNITDPNYGEVGVNGDEVDKIRVEYGDGFSFNGLTNKDITVTMTRTLSSGKDRSVIDVNKASYSGSSATFDLDGRFTTDAAGPIEVKIDGLENGGAGVHTPTITLIGDAPDKSFERTIVLSSD